MIRLFFTFSAAEREGSPPFFKEGTGVVSRQKTTILENQIETSLINTGLIRLPHAILVKEQEGDGFKAGTTKKGSPETALAVRRYLPLRNSTLVAEGVFEAGPFAARTARFTQPEQSN